MAQQSLIFPPDLNPITVRNVLGEFVSVGTILLSPPIAVHESLDFSNDQQSVTHVPSGFAFRNQLLPTTAQALANALLAGIPGSWALEWTNPDDMPDQERTNLLALLTLYPDDATGSIEITVLATLYPVTAVFCSNTPGIASFQVVVPSAVPFMIAVATIGTYTAYGFQSDGPWGQQLGTTVVVQGALSLVTVTTDQPAPAVIPCL